MIHEIIRCNNCGRLFTDEEQTRPMYCPDCRKLGVPVDELTKEWMRVLLKSEIDNNYKKYNLKTIDVGMVRDLQIQVMLQDDKWVRTLLRTPGGEWVPLTSEETEELTGILLDISDTYEDIEERKDGNK